MHCSTCCWRLVDGREDSLELTILLELCELEVFLARAVTVLFSWELSGKLFFWL